MMLRSQHQKNRQGNETSPRIAIAPWSYVLLMLVVLVLSGCRPGPREPQVKPPPAPTAAEATPVAANPTDGPTATPAASPTGTATAMEPVAGSAGIALASIPVLGEQLAAGWDTAHSWSTQFEASQDQGPAGATAYRATFYGDNTGLFLEVKQDSLVRYLRANYVAARVWINPGAADLPAAHLKLAVLSSDRHSYWDMGERPVPFDPISAADEATLPVPKGVLPANTWTEVQIWFNQLPSPPAGRYLTGLYLKAENMSGQSILLSRLELLAVPDDTRPEPLSVSVVDLDSLRVIFSKDVDPVTAENPANYQISSAKDPAYSRSGAPASVRYDPDTTSALLTLAQALQPGADYSVEVRQIADLAPQPHVQAAPATLTFVASFAQARVDLTRPLHQISPFIYGIAGSTPEYMQSLRPRVTNWGGNPTTRYNWELGNAFNAGSDWEYRNTDYGYPAGSVTDQFILDAQAVGADVRMTLPTLGWVAKNSNDSACSFTGPDGKCYNPQANCQKPGAVADPNRANVPVDVNWVVRWVQHMVDKKGFNVRFFAFDNEPDLWGFTHYDVHPDCTTYDEILNKYLTYAKAVRAVAPKAELLGPVSCCWYFYWNSSAGDADKAKHDNRDFLPWFLDQVRRHDEKAGVRTLDALDIHYYPENVYNDKADGMTAAARLEATRALWDKSYVDPSWIAEPVNLIPRLKQVIAENYRGTKLFISEWNFGGAKSMSGALAIADVLGIFGQEDLYGAAYYQSPELNTPGFFGFKMYTNYDDRGGSFGDTALAASSTDREQLAVYASRDSGNGMVTIMLINKLPDRALPVTLQLDGFAAGQAELFRYGQDHLEGIVKESIDLTANSTQVLPPYSITLLVLPQQGK